MPATSVSPQSLGYSVSRESGADFFGDLDPCERRGEGRWICRVPEPSGSAAADYRVEMRGSKCWRAELRHPLSEGEMPNQADGCVRIRDQLRLWFDRAIPAG